MKYDRSTVFTASGVVNGIVAVLAASAGHSYIAALCGFASGHCLAFALTLSAQKSQ